MRPVNETSTAEHLPGELMTLEEWAAMPEDDEGELVDGVLVEEEMPDLTHETAALYHIKVDRMCPFRCTSFPGHDWARGRRCILEPGTNLSLTRLQASAKPSGEVSHARS